MRIPLLTRLYFLTSLAVLLFSCKKTDHLDDSKFQKDRLTELIMPLQPGKYITYRVDSTVFTNFGKTTEIHSYLVKHVVDTSFMDNLGQLSFRVYTYLSDTTGAQPWQPNGVYVITVLDNQVQVTEDNMRIIKLHLPIQDGNTWKGNSYLPEDAYSPTYNFSNDDDMGDWDFLIDGGLQASVSMQGVTYTNVYTVTENNDIDPVTDPSDYGSESVSQEMYSENIGLVYRELTMWEQQPNPSGNPPDVTYDPYQVGFGIKMWMVDHN